MIEKNLTVYCNECAISEPLQSGTIKEAQTELTNMKWTKVGTDKDWICPNCTLRVVKKEATEEA